MMYFMKSLSYILFLDVSARRIGLEGQNTRKMRKVFIDLHASQDNEQG
jgi:hypothetical protein